MKLRTFLFGAVKSAESKSKELAVPLMLEAADMDPLFASRWLKTPMDYTNETPSDPHLILQLRGDKDKLLDLKHKINVKRRLGVWAYIRRPYPGLLISEDLNKFEQYMSRVLRDHTGLTPEQIRENFRYKLICSPKQIGFFSHHDPYLVYSVSGPIPNIDGIRDELEADGSIVKLHKTGDNHSELIISSTLTNFIQRLNMTNSKPADKMVMSDEHKKFIRRHSVNPERRIEERQKWLLTHRM